MTSITHRYELFSIGSRANFGCLLQRKVLIGLRISSPRTVLHRHTQRTTFWPFFLGFKLLRRLPLDIKGLLSRVMIRQTLIVSLAQIVASVTNREATRSELEAFEAVVMCNRAHPRGTPWASYSGSQFWGRRSKLAIVGRIRIHSNIEFW